MMNNSISSKEFYSSLVALCALILAHLTIVTGETVEDMILIFITLGLIILFAYKSYQAKKDCSKRQPVEE